MKMKRMTIIIKMKHIIKLCESCGREIIRNRFCSQKCVSVYANNIQKINKTGFYDIKFQIEMNRRGASKGGKIGGKLGGLNAQKILRRNVRNLDFENNYYDSKPEIEISLCLQYQYNYKPIEGETLHVSIGDREYDYLIEVLKLFIEYHIFWKNDDDIVTYYYKRRKNLDDNNYKNYKLVVIA